MHENTSLLEKKVKELFEELLEHNILGLRE